MSHEAAFQSLIDDAVRKGVAPGFQCVVFDRTSLIYNGISGLVSAPTADAPSGKPFTREHLLWLASCSKLSLSLIVLHIVEKGLAKSGFSLKDLDNHDALVKVLPEFKHGSGSLVTQIIEGFEEKRDEKGRKPMKLKDAKGRVTLRMLLTHTSGLAYDWNHPLAVELVYPSDGSTPHFQEAGKTGNIRDFEYPLVNEPGTAYNYGPSADWLGQFAVRSTGKSLRELHKDIVFDPLGILASEIDLWISPSLSTMRSSLHIRASNGGWDHRPHNFYMTEGAPPAGKSYRASGAIFSSLQAYAKVLQAVLRKDAAILGEDVWDMALKDDLTPRGIRLPTPEWKSTLPTLALDTDEFSKSTIRHGTAVNMLQTQVTLAPTISGRPAGSIAWAGLPNVYFFADPVNGLGAIIGTQILPFYDYGVVEVRDKLESLIYKIFGEQ